MFKFTEYSFILFIIQFEDIELQRISNSVFKLSIKES